MASPAVSASAATGRRFLSHLGPALGVGTTAFLLYLATLAPSVVKGDGGELQLVLPRLGVPHPTGYPLLTLVGWLFARLPLGGDVAWRINLLSAIGGALAVILFVLFVRAIGVGRGPAAAVALTMAASPELWKHAQAAEVYGLAHVFIFLVLWLLWRWGRGQTPLWWVGLGFGLGLTHHINLRLLILPALLYLFLVDRRLFRQPRRWLPAVVALLGPLLLYGLLPLRAAYFQALPDLQGRILGVPKPVAAGLISPHYYGGFWNLVLALDYGRQWLGATDPLGWTAIEDAARLALRQFPWPALLLLIPGWIGLARRDGRFTVLLLLAWGLWLWAALRFWTQVGENGGSFIPLYSLLAVWMAVGAEGVLGEVRRRWPRLQPRLGYGFLVVLWLLPVVQIAQQWQPALARRQVDVREQALALLQEPLPPGAVIVGDWEFITPLRYLQRLEGIRPDLWIIHAGPEGAAILQPRAAAEGIPFLVLRVSPAGWRLLPVPAYAPVTPAHPDRRHLDAAVRWLGYDLASTVARGGEVLSLTFYWEVDTTPTANWTTFIHLIDATETKWAQVDRMPVGLVYPPTAWQPGRTIVDPYELVLPADLPPGRYQLIFGAYQGDRRFIWADGSDVQFLTTITVRE